MTDKLTEYKDINTNAINSLTPNQQREWYLRIKNSLPQLKELGSTIALERAILDYEKRNGIA